VAVDLGAMGPGTARDDGEPSSPIEPQESNGRLMGAFLPQSVEWFQYIPPGFDL